MFGRLKLFIVCMILLVVVDVVIKIAVGSEVEFMDLIIISVVCIWLGEGK